MADFRTHVTFSSVLGCGYSVAGMMSGMNASTALVAGGLCGVAGMLPDVDSDSGVPRREAMGFAAAIVPMLLVDRFKQMQFEHDQMVFTAAVLYFFIRFVGANLIGKWSVHRGMWHSIPAVLIFAGLAFLIAGPADNLNVRYFKAFAVGLGAMSHLVLDEIYSVDTRGVIPKFKKSFGSAVKMWGKNGWANFSTYMKLGVVTLLIMGEPSVMARIELQNPQLADRLKEYHQHLGSYPIPAPAQPTYARPQQAYAQPTAPDLTPDGNLPYAAAPNFNYAPPQQPVVPGVDPRSWQPSGGSPQPFSAQAPGIRRQ